MARCTDGSMLSIAPLLISIKILKDFILGLSIYSINEMLSVDTASLRKSGGHLVARVWQEGQESRSVLTGCLSVLWAVAPELLANFLAPLGTAFLMWEVKIYILTQNLSVTAWYLIIFISKSRYILIGYI